MQKKVYLTIDIEEWYHLDYLKEYELNKSLSKTIPQIFDFLDVLDYLNIKATFFILGEIAEENADIIKDIHDRGHEIGCHGLDHELLYNKSDDEFKEQVLNAKDILNKVIGKDVVNGYRASCFSMDRKKLEILRECGYKYDSSYISFAQHPLYGSLDLNGFDKVEDLIYINDDFLEFEIPTYKIGKYNIPISGGGYLRLFPYVLNSFLIKKYLKENNNFILYLHPFELTDVDLPLDKNINMKNRLRAQVGRKKNLKKLEKILKMLLNKGAEFGTLEEEYFSQLKKRGK